MFVPLQSPQRQKSLFQRREGSPLHGPLVAGQWGRKYSGGDKGPWVRDWPLEIGLWPADHTDRQSWSCESLRRDPYFHQSSCISVMLNSKVVHILFSIIIHNQPIRKTTVITHCNIHKCGTEKLNNLIWLRDWSLVQRSTIAQNV